MSTVAMAYSLAEHWYTPGELRGAENIRRYVLAGRSDFRLESAASGRELWYKVDEVTNPEMAPDDGSTMYFVYALPEDSERYRFLGCIFVDGESRRFVQTKGSKFAGDAKEARAFRWFWRALQSGKGLQHCRVYHSGTCGCCSATLSESGELEIETGLKERCRKRASGEWWAEIERKVEEGLKEYKAKHGR